MQVELVTKQTFLTSLSCPACAWRLAHQTETVPLTPYDKFLNEQELDVHTRAQMLFPEGILITGEPVAAVRRTTELLSDADATTLFEAAFMIHNGIARADILRRKADGWHLYEVKSGLEPQDAYLDDLAFTTLVCTRAGLPLSACSLLLLSRNYQYGMSIQALFAEYDCTMQVFERAEAFWQRYDRQARLILSPTKPASDLKPACRTCDYVQHCRKESPAGSVLDLPGLHRATMVQLQQMGVAEVADIDEDFPLTARQKNARHALRAGKAYLDRAGLDERLGGLEHPLFFLGFETVLTALPLYPQTTPHTQIPTQYSLHVASEDGHVVLHHEYLADPKKDCRRQLAEKLIAHCDSRGSILSYGPFEKIVLTSLLFELPDLTEPLQELLVRVVDLCQILQDHYYHPRFHGSYALSDVVEVLAPQVHAAHLEISDSAEAMAEFACLARGRYPAEQERQVRRHLLEYGKRDTLTLVKLYERLREMTRNNRVEQH